MRLYVYHLNQCNPKRCTAKKLERFKVVKLFRDLKKVPKGGILLDPYVKERLSMKDRNKAERRGIVTVDCSWENAKKEFFSLRSMFKPRSLPYLLSVNPTNFGKPYILSSVEAFSSALYILDFVESAEKILSGFKWGENFIKLNRELLESYRGAKSSEEVLRIEKDIIEEIISK